MMLFKTIIAVYSENHTKSINTLRAEYRVVYVKVGRTTVLERGKLLSRNLLKQPGNTTIRITVVPVYTRPGNFPSATHRHCHSANTLGSRLYRFLGEYSNNYTAHHGYEFDVPRDFVCLRTYVCFLEVL
jgi:hypothetical protein